ncbi:polysaccharide biosynthesis/export family protein [Roseiconus lacunae]|uniref:Polysaccharide biosynthesis/export family protein n=1 Tax=Roseiconus lacunae TaxID=2605694 RepID=A0ABT7PDJ7_9BACT|nr:polysaccharide biosynthesis/export family protein [Roseiconus lacunae]MCD0459876.1 polysaccharide biosynthesis/export family protein [Roseiconus lacunae]MDM4014575.1 polysaccharide biosynthesis/export family protein [Roseiconus lacunae]WRQ49893.1 polysaccharide biosynthesis/export family protein [Stieleria sp. HD01]
MLLLLAVNAGCAVVQHHQPPVTPLRPVSTPRELCKTTLPQYRVEPPDILNINVVRLVPNASYRFNTSDLVRVSVTRNSLDRLVAGDVISVRVPGAPAVSPIDGTFIVQPDGTVSLGTPYGSVKVVNMTLEQAADAIESSLSQMLVASETYVALAQAGIPVDGEFAIEIDGTVDFGHPYGRVSLDGLNVIEAREALQAHFETHFTEPTVTFSLIQSSALQQIVGEHMVGPDGFVTLGAYGSVRVVGMTLDEANQAIADVLSRVLDEPKVATSVLAYNSKQFYIITQGAGVGDGVFRFPITGNETVLDALSLINGLPQGASTEMWVARPNHVSGKYSVMPVDWDKVTSLAETSTNYQLLPGDRLYVRRDPFLAFDTKLAKFTAPLERILGFGILGAETATRLSGPVLNGGGNPLGRRF